MTAALRRAATSRRLLVLAALLFTVGPAGGTWAYFSAQTETQQSTFAAGWIGAPTGLSAPAVAGDGAMLNWTTAATHGAASEAIYATDFGTTMPADCSTATYTTPFLTSIPAGNTAANPDRGSGDSGNWICYQVRGVSGNWFTGAKFSGPLQVGLVPTGISVNDQGNGANSKFNDGDSITISFNQPVSYSGLTTIDVCLFTSGVILLGDANGACSLATDTPVLGEITGLTIASAADCSTSTVATASPAITVTAGCAKSDKISVSGTGTYVGSRTQVTSTAGSASQCTAAGTNQCRPSTSFDVFQ